MAIKIPKELTNKYGVIYEPINLYGDEKGIYRQFLVSTDYICNKIVEGVSTKEDYATELQYRQIARQELSSDNTTEEEDSEQE